MRSMMLIFKHARVYVGRYVSWFDVRGRVIFEVGIGKIDVIIINERYPGLK